MKKSNFSKIMKLQKKRVLPSKKMGEESDKDAKFNFANQILDIMFEMESL